MSYACIGQEFVISKSTKVPYNLTSDVSIFVDSSATFSFEEVKKLQFKENIANQVLLPFSNQTTWLKLALKNNSSADSIWYFIIDNPLVRKTTLYAENQLDSMMFEPFKVRGFGKIKSPYFQIKLKQDESKTFYFKIESLRGLYIVLQLHDTKGFEILNASSKIGFGFISGLTCMVIFIVFAIGFLVVKDSNSKAYAIYTLIRALGFWATTNVLGSAISGDSVISEKISFILNSVTPMASAFLALNILPFDKLPKWIKNVTYGIMVFNLLLLIYLLGAYGSIPLKYLVILTVLSNLFFYIAFIFTLVKKTNQYPYYSIPFLVGNLANFVLNARVLGIVDFDDIMQLAVILTLLEVVVYVYYLSLIFRVSLKNQAEKLKNLAFEAEKTTKLQELDKLKTRFFTNISHEFRTPLTLLVGPIDDLKKKFPHEGIIDAMQRNLQRLQTLINQLLDLSKLEAGEMKPQVHELDLSSFFNQLFASFESLGQNKQIIFNHSLSHTSQPALFDADKLEKIVMNLLSNAFKFTPENGRINVRVGYMKDRMDISVQDTGIGISPERLPHIFDRFYQVEEHNNHEGTGIGLALVKELVDLLGGTIDVKSEKGVGTTFNLALPFTPIKKLSNPAQQLDRKITMGESFINANTTIDILIEADGQSIMLIVEDNPDLRNYIASVFENDYQLVLAVDGEDGLSKAIEFIPDIVISDLMMPKLDGLAFCEKLKTDERTNHIPVVMLTAKAGLSDRLIGLEKGADDYLSKPFNKEELQVRVKNLINQRALLFEKYSSQKVEEIKEPTVDERFVQKCYSIIDKYLDRSEFDVEKFADEMNLSSVQLRRKLKAITEQTVTEFVRNYRLGIAANLLKNSDLSVSEIAYKVGFESLPYFSKVFQEKYEKTASEWK